MCDCAFDISFNQIITIRIGCYQTYLYFTYAQVTNQVLERRITVLRFENVKQN